MWYLVLNQVTSKTTPDSLLLLRLLYSHEEDTHLNLVWELKEGLVRESLIREINLN